ncbi:hypothetical protein [Luteimonas chenhongjianii]|uniref:hypothetical protein n=1 Tax=Luteimonas chenhongjianii TaxID=2006110 RepID=UPI003CCC2F4F
MGALAQELTNKLRKSASIDWQNRKDSRTHRYGEDPACALPLPNRPAATSTRKSDRTGGIIGRSMGRASA